MMNYSEEEIQLAFEHFVGEAQRIVSEYMEASFPTLPKQEIAINEGSVYWKLIRQDEEEAGVLGYRSTTVHAFVRKRDGAIFKAASWASPQTKGKSAIRAYVTDEWASSVLTPHGVAYVN